MGRNVLLAVTGGIAAYKAIDVMRDLQKAGCDVRVMMTEDAKRFVGTVTFEALSGHPVADDLYDYADHAIPHIFLANWANVVAVVPATGNVMAKMAAGIADDCVTSTLLAFPGHPLVAAAMNTHMWNNPATQANLRTLVDRGVDFVMPQSGLLACGDFGDGKLADTSVISDAILQAVERGEKGTPLAGRSLVITAGPTHEAIDPVRFIANASTGKMGYALARVAARRGANVTLVTGPTALATPYGVTRVDVTSAAQMHEAVMAAWEGADAAVCCAAVADYTPASPADHKLKKARERIDRVELVETTDILAALGHSKAAGQVVVGFAAETNDLLANATAKLESKGADLIVANDVSRPESTFGSDTNRVALVGADGIDQLETMPLDEVASAILDRVADLLDGEGACA